MAEDALQLDALCARASEELKQAERENRAGAFARLAATLTDIDSNLREEIQRATAERIRLVLEKLDGKEPLTADELQVVRLWIVGDAESYLRAEDDAEEWRADLRRIMSELEDMKSSGFSPADAARLRGLVHDAIRTAWDLHHHLEHGERVGAFTGAAQELDPQEKAVLKTTLQRMLESERL